MTDRLFTKVTSVQNSGEARELLGKGADIVCPLISREGHVTHLGAMTVEEALRRFDGLKDDPRLVPEFYGLGNVPVNLWLDEVQTEAIAVNSSTLVGEDGRRRIRELDVEIIVTRIGYDEDLPPDLVSNLLHRHQNIGPDIIASELILYPGYTDVLPMLAEAEDHEVWEPSISTIRAISADFPILVNLPLAPADLGQLAEWFPAVRGISLALEGPERQMGKVCHSVSWSEVLELLEATELPRTP